MSQTVPPGGTIGIFGGGQLGRMTALAAAELGYACHIYCPDPDSPAFAVAAKHTCKPYDDENALLRFSKSVDVVTFEFENVPADSVRLVAEKTPVRPGWTALETSQDRILEKSFFNKLGIATAPWRAVDGPQALAAALKELGAPAVLKSTRLGYDGKGQVKIARGDDPKKAWAAMGSSMGILEGFVEFDREISVIVARSPTGAVAAYDPVDNVHSNHILDLTIAPARIPEALADKARAIACGAADALKLEGLLAVEMFVTTDGRLLVNEMAPRPHNSGHWTLDACAVSQFEQLVRAVCGLPLGNPERHSNAEMKNLLGDDIDGWKTFLSEPHACLHLYGKKEAKPGRKMGHVTRLKPRS
ncbi:MAG: 5-(carboxyamino)imidazole ribonucleotide synthase [Alphaproteobacteria bacterium RIFOXYD12_FULL_60_8]|nr:MAG: 5-(carboxyamino)imidazole ribonucleotide synthase [Alphaproteobacteria bacterium RIFOXYD12_FULL_60_8]